MNSPDGAKQYERAFASWIVSIGIEDRRDRCSRHLRWLRSRYGLVCLLFFIIVSTRWVGFDLLFSFLIIFPPFLASLSLCHSLTSSEIKHTKSLSQKSSTPDHVCQWTIDKCTPKLFFYTFLTSVIFLLSSLSHPSPPLPSQKR